MEKYFTLFENNEGEKTAYFVGTKEQFFEKFDDETVEEYFDFFRDDWDNAETFEKIKKSFSDARKNNDLSDIYLPDCGGWYELVLIDENGTMINYTDSGDGETMLYPRTHYDFFDNLTEEEKEYVFNESWYYAKPGDNTLMDTVLNDTDVCFLYETKYGKKKIIKAGTEWEVGEFLVGNKNNNHSEAYYRYMDELSFETDKEKMQAFLDEVPDESGYFEECLEDGCTENEALQKTYTEQVSSVELWIIEIEEKLKRRNRQERSQHLYELELAMGIFGTYGLEVVTR